MDDQDFDRKLAHIVGTLNPTDPNVPAGPVLDAAKARVETLRRTAQALQESLDSLRVSVKYLVFDLEATRRENAELRQQIARLRGTEGGNAAKG